MSRRIGRPTAPRARQAGGPRPLRLANRQPPPRLSPRAACAARAGASTPSAPPATKATPPSPPRCALPIRRCCTTVPAGSSFSVQHQVGSDRDPLRDVLLGIVSATEEPMAGGRHKVFGRHDLNVIPQTSTIASHLPRAVGVAFLLARAHASPDIRCPWPQDAVVVCSFGDASANHSTAVGAINAALNAAYQRVGRAAAVGVRGQRHRHQRQDAARLGRERLRRPRGLTVLRRRRLRRRRHVRRDVRGRRLRPAPSTSGLPAPHTVRLMGHAGSDYEVCVPQPARHRRRLRPRSRPGHRPDCCSTRSLDPPRSSWPSTRHKRAARSSAWPRRSAELPQLDSPPPSWSRCRTALREPRTPRVTCNETAALRLTRFDTCAGHQRRAARHP